MKYQLTALEARVIGCLLEKQVTTPEQYPLSVNGVVTACNQKTNREPVMNLSESEVQEQLDNLVKRHYLRTVSGFGNRVTKYEQRFCNYCVVPRRRVNCAAAPRECMNSAIWRKWSRRWNNWQIAKMVLLWCVWPANRVNVKAATCIFSVVRLKISRR